VKTIGCRFIDFAAGSFEFAHDFAGEFKPVYIVNDAMPNGVGDCWLADHCMPLATGSWAVISVDLRW